MVCSADAPSNTNPVFAEIAVNADQKQALRQKSDDVKSVGFDKTLPSIQPAERTPPSRRSDSVWLLAFCCTGIMISFSLNAVVLEKITTHRVLGELSLTCVTCVFYALAAKGLHLAAREKKSDMPQKYVALVGMLAFGSTIASMVALRYVTFITRILGKSCKSIPVMLMGVFLGKNYPLKKYLSVLVLSAGVAVFLVGTAHEKEEREGTPAPKLDGEEEHTPNLFFGMSLLVLSLLFDGATGALEDKYLEQYHIGAFDLMYYVNMWKGVFALIGMIVMGEVPTFVRYVIPSLPDLALVSLTGALGQGFIFFTISKFGALTTSIVGTCRKVLSIVLSVILFGHVLSMEQTVGLTLAFSGIGLNWVRFNCFPKKQEEPKLSQEQQTQKVDEVKELLHDGNSDTTTDSSDEELEAGVANRTEEPASSEVERGLELLNAWQQQTDPNVRV